MNFFEVWKRIEVETDIKNNTQLAKIIEKTPAMVSKKKKEGKEFPIEWAYLVAEKYNLSTKWLLTGKGKKREDEGINSYILEINEWFEEIINEDPENENWFRVQFKKKFPEFGTWWQRKNEVESRNNPLPRVV